MSIKIKLLLTVAILVLPHFKLKAPMEIRLSRDQIARDNRKQAINAWKKIEYQEQLLNKSSQKKKRQPKVSFILPNSPKEDSTTVKLNNTQTTLFFLIAGILYTKRALKMNYPMSYFHPQGNIY